jgi:DNA polymerase-3 subunit alpha
MIHLHTHTHYSCQDGLNDPFEMIAKVKKMGANAMAVTDHGNCNSFGELFLWQKNNKDFKILFGCEFYLNNTLPDKKVRKNNHLILIARNEEGIKDLFRLLFWSGRDNFFYKPRITHNMFNKINCANLICSSACLAGDINQSILNKDFYKASELVEFYLSKFGKNFYLELMFLELKKQHIVNQGLLNLSEKYGIKTIITNDCHYADKESWKVHRTLLRLQSKKTIKDKLSHKDKLESGLYWEFEAKELYLKSKDDIYESVEKWDYDISDKIINDSFENINEIVDKCDYIDNVDTKPKLIIPISFRKYDDRFSVLEKICYKKLKCKNLEDNIEYKNRLDYELSIIKKKNFVDYFLLVYEIIYYARNKLGIFVSSGRGSSASSLICYLLDITQIDPVKYDLIFERFIRIEREDFPDIDIDFSDKKQVIDFLIEKYGQNNVAFISIFSKFKFRVLFKDLCRVYGIDLKIVEKVIKDIDKVYKQTDDIGYNECLQFDSFKELVNKYSFIENGLEILSNKYRHIGKHSL